MSGSVRKTDTALRPLYGTNQQCRGGACEALLYGVAAVLQLSIVALRHARQLLCHLVCIQRQVLQ